MPPQLATLVCFAFIGAMLWLDRRRVPGVSRAIWIPFTWMFLGGSRFASQWIALGPPQAMSAAAYDEGSPLDRNVFLALLLAGAWVVWQRRPNWASLLGRNPWIVAFFAFAALSIFWADDPFIAFKRWIKGVGTLIMVLVIVTERRSLEALGVILRRLAFVLIPLSILFIKFYPDLGRSYHMGAPMFTGVTFQKNSLGQLCLYLAIYFAWALLYRREIAAATGRRAEALPLLLTAPLIAWTLYMSHSATSMALAVAGVSMLAVTRLRVFRASPRTLLAAGVLAVAVAAVLEVAFDMKETLIRFMGRDPDLTDRKPVWEMLLEMVPNALIGAGYESFWSGPRLGEIWRRMGTGGTGIQQAHNGYLELYLSLGAIGVGLLALAILAALLAVRRDLRFDYPGAVFRLVLLIVVVVYNYTEAAYKPLNNLFILLLFCMLCRRNALAASLQHEPKMSVPVPAENLEHGPAIGPHPRAGLH
jgi:O-antigen ligase